MCTPHVLHLQSALQCTVDLLHAVTLQMNQANPKSSMHAVSLDRIDNYTCRSLLIISVQGENVLTVRHWASSQCIGRSNELHVDVLLITTVVSIKRLSAMSLRVLACAGRRPRCTGSCGAAQLTALFQPHGIRKPLTCFIYALDRPNGCIHAKCRTIYPCTYMALHACI